MKLLESDSAGRDPLSGDSLRLTDVLSRPEEAFGPGPAQRRQQILEVILGMAHKVISNYTNHVAKTPVDKVFKKFAWEKPAAAEAA